MTKYYIATFSDGTVTRRSTTARDYTHGWVARRKNKQEWIDKGHPEVSQDHGFSSSEINASNMLRRYCWGEMAFAEIAPAFEVSAKQYKAAAK